MRKEKLDIIFEDKNIVVVNKPAHLLTVSTEKEHEKTLFYKVSAYEKTKHKSNKVFIVHRLDSLVRCREYIAIVEGKMDKNKGTIKSWLKENKNYVTYSSQHPGDGKLAITKYKVISTNTKYSLLKVNIDTGRKNQIRVHMNDLGCPIIGDKKYGAKSDPIRRMGLHASKLELIHPITKEKLVLEAKIPLEFYKIFDKKTFTA